VSLLERQSEMRSRQTYKAHLRDLLRQKNLGAIADRADRWAEARRLRAEFGFSVRKQRVLDDLRCDHIRIPAALKLLRKLGLSARDANAAVLEAIRFPLAEKPHEKNWSVPL
jgi:hypothetical protein